MLSLKIQKLNFLNSAHVNKSTLILHTYLKYRSSLFDETFLISITFVCKTVFK